MNKKLNKKEWKHEFHSEERYKMPGKMSEIGRKQRLDCYIPTGSHGLLKCKMIKLIYDSSKI